MQLGKNSTSKNKQKPNTSFLGKKRFVVTHGDLSHTVTREKYFHNVLKAERSFDPFCISKSGSSGTAFTAF